MKKIIAYLICVTYLLGSGILLVSCSKDDQIPDTPDDDETINEWIEQVMRENYLWSNEIPESAKLNFSADAKTFYYSLLSLKDGKTLPGRPHYYYSFIEKNKDYNGGTRTSIDPDNTYGMEYMGFNMYSKDGKPLGYIWARILYVLPGSPASEAGLKRGDWITGINGVDNITDNAKYASLLTGGNIKLAIGEKNPRMVDLKASRPVESNPLHYHAVLPVDGKKIGYLVYNHFTRGPKGDSDKTYDEEMVRIFQDFKSQGVNEFVLDLRYNGGGNIISATLLAALLVPEQSKKDIFCISTDNKGKKNVYNFNGVGSTPSLNLNGNRLYVLTSGSSASASEAVINGLIPFMDVIQIGGVTEGKNVGSYHYADNRFEWAIQPIALRVTSSKTDVDYSNGLQPDYFWDEFNMEQNTTDELLPFGDINEFMLGAAVWLITGEQQIAKSKAFSDKSLGRQMFHKSIDRFKTNGIEFIPDFAEKVVD